MQISQKDILNCNKRCPSSESPWLKAHSARAHEVLVSARRSPAANGEQDLRTPTLHRASTAAARAARHGPADAEHQELPAQNPGPCAPTHQHEMEGVPLQHSEHFVRPNGELTQSASA